MDSRGGRLGLWVKHEKTGEQEKETVFETSFLVWEVHTSD